MSTQNLPRTIDVWAKQFPPTSQAGAVSAQPGVKSGAVPTTPAAASSGRPSTESVWARQFAKKTPAATVPSPGAFTAKAVFTPLGFRFSSIRGAATASHATIRRDLAAYRASKGTGNLDLNALARARSAIESLGASDPEAAQLVNELFEAVGPAAA